MEDSSDFNSNVAYAAVTRVIGGISSSDRDLYAK